MKIFILPVNRLFRPEKQSFKYPHHNKPFGIEEDFNRYILKHKYLIARSASDAQWHYLPVYWNRYHVGNNYGISGIAELQEHVRSVIVNDEKTFTICQYSDGPLVDLGRSIVFYGSRKIPRGYDVPLICSPHKKPWLRKPEKKYLASFIGRNFTHPIREQIAACFSKDNRFSFHDGDLGTREFVRTILQSYVSLCPRGHGGSSFRFYESMQLGVVPYLIGDIDTRPFQDFINWNEISLFSNSVEEMIDVFNSHTIDDFQRMGENAARTWRNDLSYQNWCKFVLKELSLQLTL